MGNQKNQVRDPLTEKTSDTDVFLWLPQHFDFPLPSPLKVFEMLVVPEQEYPLVCVAISQGSDPSQVVRFETINLNSCSSWFTEIGTSESRTRTTGSVGGFNRFFVPSPPTDNQQVDAIHVTQLERDTVLVCLDREFLAQLKSASVVFAARLMRLSSSSRKFKDREPPGTAEVQQEAGFRTELRLLHRIRW